MTSSDPLRPNSFDHVAFWVADRQPISDLLCEHLGMHVIDSTDRFTLVGADARRGKLTLFDAPGPREPGALVQVGLRVSDLERAVSALPAELDARRSADGEAVIEVPEGIRIALVEVADTDLDYDLDHVVLRVSDVEAARRGFAELGMDHDGERLLMAGRELRLEPGGEPEGDRPLLNHLAVLVDSASAVEEESRRRGIEIDSVVDAANTLAVFLWGPDRIRVEYVEHKPGFSLV